MTDQSSVPEVAAAISDALARAGYSDAKVTVTIELPWHLYRRLKADPFFLSAVWNIDGHLGDGLQPGDTITYEGITFKLVRET
jgi:hypothetical protein